MDLKTYEPGKITLRSHSDDIEKLVQLVKRLELRVEALERRDKEK